MSGAEAWARTEPHALHHGKATARRQGAGGGRYPLLVCSSDVRGCIFTCFIMTFLFRSGHNGPVNAESTTFKSIAEMIKWDGFVVIRVTCPL